MSGQCTCTNSAEWPCWWCDAVLDNTWATLSEAGGFITDAEESAYQRGRQIGCTELTAEVARLKDEALELRRVLEYGGSKSSDRIAELTAELARLRAQGPAFRQGDRVLLNGCPGKIVYSVSFDSEANQWPYEVNSRDVLEPAPPEGK